MENPFDVTAANDTGDFVLSFQFEDLPVRGRLVALEHTASTILSHHTYPPSVARCLGEMLAATAGLASLLNFEGAFNVQTTSDGTVPFIICDITKEGGMRGYARMRTGEVVFGHHFRELLGNGYLAFTAMNSGERYQGIVPLEGQTLAGCIEGYFAQSEQTQTLVHVAAGGMGQHGWQAAALILQQLPTPSKTENTTETTEEAWERLEILLNTLSSEELLTYSASDGHGLLYRLFAEDAVRVYDPTPIKAACRCSRGRILAVLESLPTSDITDMVESTEPTVFTCEFCNSQYAVSTEELATILEQRQ